MDRVKQAAVGAARDFFSGELKVVMQKQQVQAKNDSFEYLVDLLMRFMESEKFYVRNPEGKLEENYLVKLYAQYLEGDAATKRIALRRLGDVCLFVTGFFADSLNRKLVDIDYYSGMGGTAYWKLSQMQVGSTLFEELAVKFKSFSSIFTEMSERSGLQTNSDLLRLYEKWLETGNDRLKSLLANHGITSPIKVDKKQKH
jgi:hypothetical protein